MIGSLLASPSKTLMSFVDELVQLRHRPAIDLGCGFGRNAVALASRGLSIVCVDKDLDRLRTLAKLAPGQIRRSMPRRALGAGKVYPVCIDADIAWPFPNGFFSAVICVHFFKPNLLDAIGSSLMPGGFLYIETFGDHGGNYLDLPRGGQVNDLLRGGFCKLFYKERKAGPNGYDAVTVRVFARKR
jgi:SAM-dependent methyltransferase